MKVDEWTITSEFDDIVQDVKEEKVESDKIWVSKYGHGESGDCNLDLEFEVKLDKRNEVSFGKSVCQGNEYSVVRAQSNIYEVVVANGTESGLGSSVVARFQNFKRKCEFQKGHSPDLTSVDITNVFDPEERVVCADSEGSIYVLRGSRNGPMEEKFRIEQGHASHVSKVRFFPNGHGFLSSGIDMRLKIWDANNGTELRTFVGHTRPVNDFAMVDRGRNFVSGSSDGCLKLWECSTASCVFSMDSDAGDGINCVALSNYTASASSSLSIDRTNEYNTEGKAVFSGHDSGAITFHDLYNRKKVLEIPSVNGSSCVTLAQSSSGENSHYLWAGHSDGSIYSWDTRNNSEPIDHLEVNSGVPITKIFLANSLLHVSSGIQYFFSLPVVDGEFKTGKLVNFIRPYEDITDFCINESYQDLWCVGNNGTMLKF